MVDSHLWVTSWFEYICIQVTCLVTFGKKVYVDMSYSYLSTRAHPAISHCSHLLLKCRVATSICYWLKVQSGWFKIYLWKVYFDQLLDFQILLLLFPSRFIIVPYFTLWTLDFFNTIWVSNCLDPDQARHFVWPRLASSSSAMSHFWFLIDYSWMDSSISFKLHRRFKHHKIQVKLEKGG